MLTRSYCVRPFTAPINILYLSPLLHLGLLLRHSKSLGPSAPIAYATSVSPPDEAAAWPGCGVPANHLPRWVPPHALLARGSVDGATNLCSPSTTAKVNCLAMRYLHFGSVLGDLQEGYFFASRCHLSRCSSTKMPFLCSKSPKMRVSNPKSAQKPRFCARNARKQGFRRAKKHKNPDFVLRRPMLGCERLKVGLWACGI